MPSVLTTLRRRAKALHRNLRGANMAVRALASTDHPLLAHIIPMRRCNLACTYCNEYDDFSKPVPIDEMYRRIDKLGSLGTAVVTISGGEPLMHPELDDVIRRIRGNGMIAGTDHQRLPAGRRPHPAPEPRRPRVAADFHRQRESRRSLEEEPEGSRQETAVAGRARRLSREHQFRSRRRHFTSAGCARDRQARVELGFTSTIGIIHDGSGQLQPLGDEERRIYHEMQALEKSSFTRINSISGQHCRRASPTTGVAAPAAAISTSAKTGSCTTARSSADILESPSPPTPATTCAANISPKKSCAPHCTVSCVHQVSIFDSWRAPQYPAPSTPEAPASHELVQIK